MGMRTGTASQPLSEFTGMWRGTRTSFLIDCRCLFLQSWLHRAVAALPLPALAHV